MGVKNWYIPFLLTKLFLFLIVMEIGIFNSLSLAVFPMVIIEIISFGVVIFCRPFSSVLHTIGSLTCSFTILFALSLAMVQQFMTFSEEYQILLIFILEALIIFSILMTIIRLLL
jgi:hypothetical protein